MVFLRLINILSDFRLSLKQNIELLTIAKRPT